VLQLLQSALASQQFGCFELTPAAAAALPEMAAQLSAAQRFGNGRTVNDWAQRVFAAVSERQYGPPSTVVSGASSEHSEQEHSDNDAVTVADLQAALQAQLSSMAAVVAPAQQEQQQQQAVRRPLKMAPLQQAPLRQAAATATTTATASAAAATATAAAEVTVEEDWGAAEAAVAAAAAVEAERVRELEQRAAELEAAQQFEALQALRDAEEQRQREEIETQQALQSMGVCWAGFQWIKAPGGWRCAGGSHYISDSEAQTARK
jgi:hypothetical protein